jgi:hypothetical protein
MAKKAIGTQPDEKPLAAAKKLGDDLSPSDYFDWREFEPAMLKGGSGGRLLTELLAYRDRLDELLLHEGQYVLIKGRVVAGFFHTRKSAVAAAIAKYGPGPVLIKKVVEREPLRRIGNTIL